ncbi:16S rRNA (uracil(1498)-N(3))-methyltransferase [Candidatus Peregrinibacteria bacterium]|nr:16S rRNA (uracil(1498)-N(3))-methyltransferase [Candidatus Peregrinibacteria bacterium]
MQRFFINPAEINGEQVALSSPAILHQINRVLRMKNGDRVIFLDNTGFEYEAAMEKSSDKNGEFHILEKRKNMAEPELFLTLYQAMPKKRELFELVLQKGTEIGVSAFVPLVTEHTERLEIGNIERLQRILREAAEQCGRGKIPQLMPASTFDEMIENEKSAVKIIFHEKAELDTNLKERGQKSALAVGPEGGFSVKEVENAKNHGWRIVSIGPRVLRTETAGIVGAALLLLGE